MKTVNIIAIICLAILSVQCNSEEGYKEFEGAMTNQNEAKEVNSPILNPHDTEVDVNKPFYQGMIVEVKDAGGYTYILIKEDLTGHKHEKGDEHNDFWIVVEQTTAQVGDEVRFQKELVTKNYVSKALGETFDELMFASNLQYKVKE
jgi:hypothetical protein